MLLLAVYAALFVAVTLAVEGRDLWLALRKLPNVVWFERFKERPNLMVSLAIVYLALLLSGIYPIFRGALRAPLPFSCLPTLLLAVSLLLRLGGWRLAGVLCSFAATLGYAVLVLLGTGVL